MQEKKDIDVIVAFYPHGKNRRLKNPKEGEVVPIKFKYKDKKVNVLISKRYYEKENGETVIVYRCFYKERFFFYKLFFYTEQLKWKLEFE
jgi:hypothetical protein